MIELNLIILGLVALFLTCVGWRLRRIKKRMEQMTKEVTTLKNENAVLETQAKHFQVRQKNEEIHRNTNRDELINSMQEQGDLRD